MKYYFGYAARQQKLKRILDSWLGTPYKHWCGIKGLGADCTHFLFRVLEEFEFGPFKVPMYPKDWNLHHKDEALLKTLLLLLPCEETGVKNLRNGDIVLFFFGKMCSHSGFYFENYIYHCVTDIGVIKTVWGGDPMWTRRAKYSISIKNEN